MNKENAQDSGTINVSIMIYTYTRNELPLLIISNLHLATSPTFIIVDTYLAYIKVGIIIARISGVVGDFATCERGMSMIHGLYKWNICHIREI